MESSLINQLELAFKSNPLFQGGFLLGMLALVGKVLQPIPKYLYHAIKRKVIYSTNISETEDLFESFEIWLTHHHANQYKNVDAVIENKKLILKQLQDVFYIKYENKRLRIFKGRLKMEMSNDIKKTFFNNFEIRGVFAKSKIKKLLLEVIEFAAKEKLKCSDVNILTLVPGYFDIWQNCGTLNSKNKQLDKIIVKDKTLLLRDINEWTSSEKWYRDRSITYKRGYIFYGLPGNGKTSLAVALALRLKRHLNVLNLNGCSDKDIKRAFEKIEPNSILLIEDIDCYFNGRETKGKADFSFSTFLNCLDGVFSTENIIVIFTTNKIEELDDALIRAGRIDFKFEVTNPDNDSINEYLSLFYEQSLKLNFNVQNKICMSDVQNICIENKTHSNKAIEKIKYFVENYTPKIIEKISLQTDIKEEKILNLKSNN